MLHAGRSVAVQIFGCDEGVMGFHNDRRADGNMSATGRRELILFILLISFYLF